MRGFTIQEVVITLVVFGILLSVAGPPLRQARMRHRAYVGSRQFRHDLHAARIRAVVDGSTVTVTIDTVDQGYTAQRKDGSILFQRRLATGLVVRTTAHRLVIPFTSRGTSNLYSTTWIGIAGDEDERFHPTRVTPVGSITTR